MRSFVVQNTNSWMSPFEVTKEDFITIDTTGVRGSRKPDGSLPEMKFMHLASGSDLIDARTNVGLPYSGNASDLGTFELFHLHMLNMKLHYLYKLSRNKIILIHLILLLRFAIIHPKFYLLL